jgi:hypothetical protein
MSHRPKSHAAFYVDGLLLLAGRKKHVSGKRLAVSQALKIFCYKQLWMSSPH